MCGFAEICRKLPKSAEAVENCRKVPKEQYVPFYFKPEGWNLPGLSGQLFLATVCEAVKSGVMWMCLRALIVADTHQHALRL
jgi:hypothetical protein